MRTDSQLLHAELSSHILECCFEISRELGSGFLEKIYKNALCIALQQKGLHILTEQSYHINFRHQFIGTYIADLVVNNLVIIELKCCQTLLPEHQAQLINYLKVSGIPIGLLINFSHPRLEYRRLQHPDHFIKNKEKFNSDNRINRIEDEKRIASVCYANTGAESTYLKNRSNVL